MLGGKNQTRGEYSRAGIFLENNFKYQNAHNNELGGAISANYRGFFSISCLLFDTIWGEWPLDIWFKGPFQILGV